MAEELVGEIICRKRGDTAPDKINVLDPESTTIPKDALDITGFTYTMTVNTEKEPDPGVPIGTEIFTISGVITDPTGGVVEFRPSASNVDQLPDTYWYDIEQVDAAGFVKTIAKNKYRFFQDISKTN